jgi:hypothetical protein
MNMPEASMHLNYNIELYLSEGLPPGAEARLRSHLRACKRCRSFYDRQVVVHRALAGNPDAPTPQEEERLLRLILQEAGLRLPEQKPQARPGLMGRIFWAPAPMLAAALLLLVLVVVGLAYSLLPASPFGPAIAAHLTQGRNLQLDGRPVDALTSEHLAVHAGVKLKVGHGGFAKLSLRRGGSVRVFPETTLSLSGPGELLELSSGKVWCLVDPADAPFMVKTDIADVRAIGTSFVVERRPSGETDVRVAKGVVEVRERKTGDAVRIEGCHEARIFPGSSPPAPDRYTPKHDRSDWNAVLGKPGKTR